MANRNYKSFIPITLFMLLPLSLLLGNSIEGRWSARVHEKHMRLRMVSEKEHGFKESRYHALKIALEVDREDLRDRIAKRTEAMYRNSRNDGGIIKEVQDVLDLGYKDDLKPLNSVGYREAVGALKGLTTTDEALELTKQSTYHNAKRQVTWFKKEPNIKWFNVECKADIMAEISEFLRS